MSELPRRWTGIDNDADQSPPLGRLRGAVAEIRGDFGDVLYYRAVVWCKKYAPQGQLENCWADLAVGIRWPESVAELRDTFRTTGIVSPPRDSLFLWWESNGRVLCQMKVDADAHREKRKTDKRRAKAAAEARKRKREQLRDSNPLLGGRSVGRSVGTPDKNQTSCRRRADAKKG